MILGAGLALTFAAVEAYSVLPVEKTLVKNVKTLSVESSSLNARRLMVRQGINPMNMFSSRKAAAINGQRVAARVAEDGAVENFYRCTAENAEGDASWMLTIKFDDANQQAEVINLGGFVDGLDLSPITATYANGAITLPAVTPEGNVDAASVLGTYYGYYTVYLAAGQFLADEGAIQLEENLNITVSEDKSEISVGGKTLAAVIVDEGEVMSIDYARYLEIAAIQQGCFTDISSKSLTFDPVLPGVEGSVALTLYSNGTEDAAYEITLSDAEHFSVSSEEGSVDACGTKDVTFRFKGQTAGDYEGTATIKFGNDTYEVALHASVTEPESDFSPIITSGDKSFFTWKNGIGDFTWLLEGNQAIPGNCGIGPDFDEEEYELDPENYNPEYLAALEASYNSEQPVKLSFDFKIHDDASCRMFLTLDADTLFTYWSRPRRLYTYDYVLPAGEHTLRFGYVTAMWADEDAVVYVENMSVEAASEWEGVTGLAPAATDGWYNLNGNAVANQENATLTYEVEVAEPSFFSFETEIAEGARLDVFVDGAAEPVSLDASQTHFDTALEAGKHSIKLQSANANRVTVTEVHQGAGTYTVKEVECLAIVQSYFDENRGYSLINGVKGSYNAKFQMSSDGRVLIEDFFPPIEGLEDQQKILGRVMSDGKIHISNAANDGNEGTYYGYLPDYDLPYIDYNHNIFLFGGTLDADQTYNEQTEIVLAPNADGTQYVTETGFGVTEVFMHEHRGYGNSFIQPGAKFFVASEGISFDQEAVDFGSTWVNVKLSRGVVVINQGAATQFAVSVEGKDKDNFTVSPQTGTIGQLDPMMVVVGLEGAYPGVYEANLVVSTEDADYSLPIKATVQAAEDYASIVTEGSGYITWATDGEYPWKVENGTATTSNQGVHNSQSNLVATVTVPEGYVATFSYDGNCMMEPGGDAYNLQIDQEVKYIAVDRIDSLTNQFVLDAGVHEVAFLYGKNNEDVNPTKGDFVSIRNVRLHLEPKAENLALRYYFAPVFTMLAGVNDLSVGDVYFINKGTQPLVLNSIESDGCFSGINVPGLTVQPNDTMTVTLVYEPNTVGHHEGTVTLHTSAGDLPVFVGGNADYVRYLAGNDAYAYTVPYCNYYTFYGISPIYTQALYSAEWMEGLEGKQIESMTFFSYGATDCPYDCPDSEWQFGETENTRIYEEQQSGLTTVKRGLQPSLADGELVIEFDEPYTYQGGNVMFQNLMHEVETQGGHLGFAFPFQGSITEEEAVSACWISYFGLMTQPFLPYMRLKYVGENPDGINNVTRDNQSNIVSIEYLDANGRRQSGLRKGMNIISVTYSDGTHRTCKQLVK